MPSRQHSDALFLAIAHPTRREILDLALATGEVSVAELRDRIAGTFSALSQHLKVLKDAGLLRDRREGRHMFYVLTPEPLLEVIGWMRGFEAAWTARMDDLGAYLAARAPAREEDAAEPPEAGPERRATRRSP